MVHAPKKTCAVHLSDVCEDTKVNQSRGHVGWIRLRVYVYGRDRKRGQGTLTLGAAGAASIGTESIDSSIPIALSHLLDRSGVLRTRKLHYPRRNPRHRKLPHIRPNRDGALMCRRSGSLGALWVPKDRLDMVRYG